MIIVFIFPGVITVDEFLSLPQWCVSLEQFETTVNYAKDIVTFFDSSGEEYSNCRFSYNGYGLVFSVNEEMHVVSQNKNKIIKYEVTENNIIRFGDYDAFEALSSHLVFFNQSDFNFFIDFLEKRNTFVQKMVDKSIEKSEDLFNRMISIENLKELDDFIFELCSGIEHTEVSYLIFLHEFSRKDDLCGYYFKISEEEHNKIYELYRANKSILNSVKELFETFARYVYAITSAFSYIPSQLSWLILFRYYEYCLKLYYSNIWNNEYDNTAITTDVENYVKDCVCRNTVSSWNDRSIVSLTYYLLQMNALCDEFRFARKIVEQYVKEEEQGKPRTHIKEVKTYCKEISPIKDNNILSNTEDANENSASAIKELESLIGLSSVKSDVEELVSLVKLNVMRKTKGLPEIPVSLHLVFTGNPGTGKTTVARILAKIYKEIGILSKGQLVEVDRSGLVAGYVGQTAIKTQEKIQEAIGGILFIDEAYTLVKDGNDFGQEAIDTLLKAMEDKRENLVVIVAGYPELMKKFISSNPGLRSRFNKYIHFDDYSINELVAIFDRIIGKYHYTITDEAKRMVMDKIALKVSEKDASFANAREIRNMFEHIVSAQALRVAKMNNPSEEDITQITEEDIV